MGPTADHEWVSLGRNRRARTRVRTRLAGLLLVPVVGAVGFAGTEAYQRREVADRAADAEALVESAKAALQLRLAASNEAFSAGSAATTRDFGVEVEAFGEILGIDIVARVERDQRQVDAAFAAIEETGPLAEARQALDAARADTDATAAELLAQLSAVQSTITREAARSVDAAEEAAIEVPSSATLRRTLEVVRLAHDAATAVGVQLDGLARFLLPAPDEARQAGIEQLRLGLGMLSSIELTVGTRLPAPLDDAWDEVRSSPAARSIQSAGERYSLGAVATTPPVDLAELGDLVLDGMERIDAYGAFATTTAEHAAAVAADLAADEADAARWALVAAAVVAAFALGPAALFVRTLVSPLRDLADRAAKVTAGDLSPGRPLRRGPREVVEVGTALDDAVNALRDVEAHLGAMAIGDVDRLSAAEVPPGRLGALVHQSVSRLSHSIVERERLAQRLAHEAGHDTLTGLPNRVSIVAAITQAAARAARDGRGVAVLAVELSGLRLVNSTHGHAAGNRVLCAAAERIRAELAPGDVAARVGSADFAVVVEGVAGATAAEELAARLVASLSAPVGVGAAVTRVAVNVGIAVAADGRGAADALLRDAGLAAGRARALGENRVEAFDASMRAGLLERAAVEERLTAALAAGELTLHLQPVVTPSLDAVDAEALLRWRRPDGSLVPPGEFIPVAEASDLVIDIGRFVLEEAAACLARWEGDPVLARLGLSVNLSARHVLSLTVVDDVRDALARHGVDPTRLTVEVTETVVLSDFGRASEHLGRLRELGVRVAVDDFGTGYTSLAHLRELPADVLKVDRSLVVAADADPADERVLELVVGAAHAAGMRVVAEGIETPEQLALVRRVRGDLVQGYLIARPMPEDELRRVLAEQLHV